MYKSAVVGMVGKQAGMRPEPKQGASGGWSGKAELFWNTFERWDLVIGFILLAFAIVPDMARTDTWVALQGHDASARVAAGWWLALCVIRAVLGGIVLVYVGGMFNKRIRSGEFERIAEDDMLAGKFRVKFPWLLGATLLFFLAASWGGFLLLVPAVVFLFTSPYRLRSWKTKPISGGVMVG